MTAVMDRPLPRCVFCGIKITGTPVVSDGLDFCSLHCARSYTELAEGR